jgi:type II secretory pathway component PulJ
VGGFTLLELLLALGIAATVLVILFGGLRVGLAAWSRGEERSAILDHDRSLVVLLEHPLAAAFPYRTAADDDQGQRIVFDGRPDRLTFVTRSPALPADGPIAFTAVSLSTDGPGLAVRQQPMPNRLALGRLQPVLVDRETTGVRFRYLGEEPGAWQDEWDTTKEERLPRAVEITLVTRAGALRTLTLPIQVTMP